MIKALKIKLNPKICAPWYKRKNGLPRWNFCVVQEKRPRNFNSKNSHVFFEKGTKTSTLGSLCHKKDTETSTLGTL
jgi:hypothetical protein